MKTGASLTAQQPIKEFYSLHTEECSKVNPQELRVSELESLLAGIGEAVSTGMTRHTLTASSNLKLSLEISQVYAVLKFLTSCFLQRQHYQFTSNMLTSGRELKAAVRPLSRAELSRQLHIAYTACQDFNSLPIKEQSFRNIRQLLSSNLNATALIVSSQKSQLANILIRIYRVSRNIWFPIYNLKMKNEINAKAMPQLLQQLEAGSCFLAVFTFYTLKIL